jgi:sodium transport system permease protein
MQWKYVRTVYLKELKDSLRDRRTMISVIVIPTLVLPLLTFGVGSVMREVIEKARSEVPTVMLLGASDSPLLIAALRSDKTFRIVEPRSDYAHLISHKKLRAAVKIPESFDAALVAGQARNITIYFYEGDMMSGLGRTALQTFFASYRDKVLAARLASHHFAVELLKPFEIQSENVASPEMVGGNATGGIVPYLIIVLCFSGAMYPAIDLTAGEKERGTMETLLCSPVKRINIVLGKFLMVLTASLTTMLLSLCSMGLSAVLGLAFGAGSADKLSAQGSRSFSLPPFDPYGVIGVFGMVLPIAVFFAALLLTIALCAKSYKEAQSYVSPLLIIVIAPTIIGMMPGIELSAKTAFIPILSLSLVCKEMLSGVWHWTYIAIIFASSCLYATLALTLCVRMFNREEVMFRA